MTIEQYIAEVGIAPRMATPEEQKAELLHQRELLSSYHNFLTEAHQSLHPTQPGEQPSLISLIELSGEKRGLPLGVTTEQWAGYERWGLASRFYDSQLSVQEVQAYLNTFSEEDRSGIEASLLEKIRDEIQRPQLRTIMSPDPDGVQLQFGTDQEWLAEYVDHYPQLNDQQSLLTPEAEDVQYGTETPVGWMGRALAKTKAFGRSVADFALRKGATGALHYSVRELAKGVVSWSGAFAAVGGGVAGTMATGAFVGAVAGAVVEYAHQVKSNLDQRLTSEQKADPELTERKQIFLRKIKGLGHTEVYKADLRKLGKAALFGAVVGAGAGALVEHIPQLSEFIKEHTGGLRSIVSRIGEMAGTIPDMRYSGLEGVPSPGLTEVAGGAGQVANEVLKSNTDVLQSTAAYAQSALDNLGNSISLPAGSNPWEVSAGILKQMGVVNPSPEQIMQLDKVICQESGISVPEWGIPGAINARQLPVGFNINLTDTVKEVALGIASQK